MSAIGRLTSAIASGTIDTTIALASLNFDFSLYKVEAPKEFHGVGTVLSSARRAEAESGTAHVTARKLAALFESLLPPTPQLVKAYGLRASEISSSTVKDQGSSSHGVFASQTGADGTSIWAAATSSNSAIKLHLLACMLARIWDGPEAISIWVEIVNERKLEIETQFKQNNIGDLAANMAAQQKLTRIQLAEWDASARAWLRVADAVKIKQQKQLELIIGNLKTEVNSKPSVYESVMQAWKVALEGMECLVSGMPQKMQTGEILLGLSAWHLFPDLIYIESSMITINQSDPLVHQGGILTVGLHPSGHGRPSGVSWSLPLAHLRYYGHPVLTSRSIVEDGSRSRLSINELLQAILGCIFGGWEKDGSDPEAAAKFIIQLSERLLQIFLQHGHPQKLARYRQSWLFVLSEAAKDFLTSESLERQTYIRLINLGKKRQQFLSKPQKSMFGLSDYKTYFNLQNSTEQKIRVLRDIASKAGLSSEDVFIRYCRSGPSDRGSYWNLAEYTTALPYVRSAVKRTSFQQEKPTSTHVRWIYQGRSEDFHRESIEHQCLQSDARLLFDNLSYDGCTDFEKKPESEACSRRCGQEFSEHENTKLREELPSRVLEFSELGEKIFFIEDQDIRENMNKNAFDCIISWRRPASVFSPVSVMEDDETETIPSYKFIWGDINTAALFIRDHEDERNIDNKFLIEDVTLDVDPSLSKGYQASKKRREYQGNFNQQPVEISESGYYKNILPVLTDTIDLMKIQELLTAGICSNETFVGQLSRAVVSLSGTYISSLRGIASLVKAYRLAPDATIHVRVLQTQLHAARWVLYNDRNPKNGLFDRSNTDPYIIQRYELAHGDAALDTLLDWLSPYRLNRTESFACIVMFESGDFNLAPDQFQNVMAISAGDSIFVASALLCDPLEEPETQEIQRVMGNIGRPGIALLVPPASLEIRSSNIDEWNLINHDQFDGKLQNCFQDTSLHLSFTGAELPLNVGNSGKQDVEVYILETVVSLHERGKWVADLDILKALESSRLSRVQPLGHHHEHTECRHEFEYCRRLTSLQSWLEFLDRPAENSIVCMRNNWQARLAATTIAITQSYNAIVLPEDVEIKRYNPTLERNLETQVCYNDVMAMPSGDLL